MDKKINGSNDKKGGGDKDRRKGNNKKPYIENNREMDDKNNIGRTEHAITTAIIGTYNCYENGLKFTAGSFKPMSQRLLTFIPFPLGTQRATLF